MYICGSNRRLLNAPRSRSWLCSVSSQPENIAEVSNIHKLIPTRITVISIALACLRPPPHQRICQISTYWIRTLARGWSCDRFSNILGVTLLKSEPRILRHEGHKHNVNIHSGLHSSSIVENKKKHHHYSNNILHHHPTSSPIIIHHIPAPQTYTAKSH